MADVSNGAAAELPSGWVPLGRRSTLSLLRGVVAPPSYLTWAPLCIFFALSLVRIISGERRTFWFVVGAPLVVVVALVPVALLVLVLRYPQPWVNFESSQLRLGRTILPMDEIDQAILGVGENRARTKRSLALELGHRKRPTTRFVLRTLNGDVADAELRRLLGEVLQRSAIVMPTTPEDPTGKFAHVNFPGHLTKEEALEVVSSPPDAGDRLPIPSGPLGPRIEQR